MADELIVGVGADVAAFERDAREIVQIANSLQRDIARALQGTVIVPDLSDDARAAGNQLITGLRNAVQEGGAGLQRDVAAALVPTSLGGEFTRLAGLVRAGTDNISTALGREGHEAGRALVVGIGAELPAAQQLLAGFVREANTTVSARLLTNMAPAGARAGRELVAGLRTAVQAQQGTLRSDIVGSLIPTSLATDFARLTTTLEGSADTLARALGAGGRDAGTQYVIGLASGLSTADRVVDQFRASVSTRLARARLLGDLTAQGAEAGTELIGGVTRAITSGAGNIQRAVLTALVPTNLAGQLGRITTDVSREVGRLTPLLSATGTDAGRALVLSLGSTLAQGTAVIVRDFSRGAQTAVAGLDIFGDLTPAGQRAGTQLISGLVQVVSREGTALRGTLATALIPTTVSGELGRLTATLSAGLQDVPVLFLTAGRDAGASFTSSLGTQLAESRALLTGFARDASASLTAAITVGDTGRTGEIAGRALAASIASGVAAEAPAVRSALSAALLPGGVAADVGRVVDVVKTEAAELIPSFAATGRASGAAIAEGIVQGLAPVAPALRRLTAGETIGIAIDATPIREVTAAQRDLEIASTSAASSVREVAQATASVTAKGLSDAAEVAQLLADAERNAARTAKQASADIVGARAAQRTALEGVANQAQSTALVVIRGAAQETSAIGDVTASVRAHIALLQQFAQAVNATDARAVSAWQEQAALVRDNARAIGIESAELYKLDRSIQRTIDSFRLQAAEARNAARNIQQQGGGVSRGTGMGAAAAELGNITRQANQAKTSITGLTIAGKSLQQISGRLGPAMIGVGFGLEALARGGEAGASGLRTALRSIASFAAFFGTKGLIVAGAAAATAAIIDLFKKSDDAAKEANKEFKKTITDMVRSADTIGLQKQLQELQIGKLVIDDKGIGKFEGGIVDLTEKVNQLKADITAAGKRFDFLSPKGVNALTRQLGEVEPQLTALQTRFTNLSNTIRNFPTLPRDPGLARGIDIRADTDDAKKAIGELAAEVGIVQEAFAHVNGDINRQAQILARAIPLYDTIRRSAEAHAGEVSEASNQLQDMLKALTDIDAVSIALTRRKLGGTIPKLAPVKITGIIDKIEVPAATTLTVPIDFDTQEMTRSLQQSIRDAAAAQNVLDFARLFGTRQQVADATENVNIVTANLTRTFNAARDVIMQSSEADTVKAAKLEVLTRLYGDASQAVEGLTADTRDLDSTLGDIAGAAQGIAQLGNEIGGINDDVLVVIDSVGRLANALADLSKLKLSGEGGIFSSISGLLKSIPVIGEAIASVLSLGRSAFNAISGKGEADANAAITKENTEAIQRLSQDIRRVGDTIGSLRGASRALDTSSILAARAGTSGFSRGFKNIESLDQELRKAGTSIRDLSYLAERFGIDIKDASGRVSAQGLADLNIALKLAAHAAANFENDLTSLRTIQDARRDILDIADPAAAFGDAMEQIRRFAPELAAKFFSGIGDDLSSPQARAAAEQAIRDVFEFITQQGIDLGPFLQGFESVEDFVSSLLDADHALDSFGETAKQATGEMVNVVRGFRDFNLERARFQATAAPFVGPALTPRTPTTPPGTGGTTTTVGQVVFSPTIRIDGRDKDAIEITTEVVTELRRRAKASANPEVRKTVNLLPT